MHCRGKLNSEEKLREKWRYPLGGISKMKFYRELNEQRLEDHKLILNNSIDYFTDQFRKYQSDNQEDTDVQLNLAFLYQHGYGVKKYTMRALELYTKAAEKGHRDAQYNAAYLYHITTDIKFNYRHALRWYRASATNGNIAAQNYLAYFYEKGLATDVNWDAALYWYTKAANAGNSSAQLTLGKLYRKGEVVGQNFLEAARWYKLSTVQGNKAAKNCLEQLYRSGKLNNASDAATMLENDLEVPVKLTLCSKLQKDIDRLDDLPCIKQLKALAMHALMTDGNAMYQIGLKYYNGVDLPLDKDTGYLWIKRAAMNNLREAVLKIAKMHKEGDTVQQDYYTSGVWTRKEARRKNDKAQCDLGLLYKEGLGVRKDPLEASKWFIKAGDQNNSDGRYQFGLLKYHGEGVRKDKEEAAKWFRTSALKENPHALYMLGKMYEDGDSVKKNGCKAIEFYKSAAHFGSSDAQFKLGIIYEEGKLVSQDLSRAHKYYTMAADSGRPGYQNELAINYINGVFDDPGYIKAFNLFKRAAGKNYIVAETIFRTPIEPAYIGINYQNIIDMLIFASKRGSEGMDYNIGCAYEFGITTRIDLSGSIRQLTQIDLKSALEWYTSAASKGDSRAQYRLGVIYERGKGVARDLDKAFDYYNQASSSRHVDSMFCLGFAYIRGSGVSKDLVKAFYLLTEASNLGNKQARKILIPSKSRENLEMLESVANLGIVTIQYQLGEFYKDKDHLKSFKWFTLAVEGGVIDAYYRLGRLYEKGKGTHRNYSKAITMYEKAIEKDHEEALYRLAELYLFGEIIERDYLRAYNLYSRAAKLGHAKAFRLLNEVWDTTLNISEANQEDTFNISSKRLSKAIQMFRFVAEDENADLQYQLGSFYERNVYNQNYSEAFKWYRMAANNNHLEAIYHLGLFYENGLGATQDYNEAIQLYNQAKDRRSHDALYRLGVIFHHGYGVEVDYSKAIDFYEEAAALGNSQSQYTLGRLYETGEITQKDILKALVWYTKAYLNGNTSIIPELYNLYDFKPYERFFHNKLFRILFKLKDFYKSDSRSYGAYYGSIYYKLGKMYLYGIGTIEDRAQGLKLLLKAYYDDSYKDAEPFITLDYSKSEFSSEKTFTEMLKTYREIRESIPSKHQYKLGMLYYNGYSTNVRDPSDSAKIKTLALVSKDDSVAVQYLQLASKAKYTKALRQLGIIHLKNNDTDQAVTWFSKASETLHPPSYEEGNKYYLHKACQSRIPYLRKKFKSNYTQALKQRISMYLQGDGVEKNVDEATKLIKESLQLMSPDECYNQGMKFYNGSEVSINHNVALMYLRKAAEKNHGHALAQLGIMYLQGDGVEKNVDEAMKLIKKSLQVMSPDECYDQGMKFYNGSGVSINYGISLMFLQETGKQNHAYSQARLGYMYLNGIGVDKDDEQAKRWYNKIEYEYFRKPALHIGQIYHYDCGGIQDFSKALKYYQKHSRDHVRYSANFYDTFFSVDSAIRGIGLIYEYGDGVDQDYKKALEYYRKSANYRNTGAFYNLGLLYYYGRGVEKNYKEAAKFFTRIYKSRRFRYDMHVFIRNKNDELGVLDEFTNREYSLQSSDIIYGEAQYYLGLMYKNGHGVAQNNDKSQQCFKISLESGIKRASNFIY